ncbi:MAG TPA: hypothetical protein VL737_02535 [Candidatus Pristimantibacillus sp.]|nr:hypothetical protein [Candidatus Pristimantibacillus sp.]
MPRRPHNPIYNEVIRLAREYFGPDTAKHIGKFISTHLGKPAEQMTKDELVSLTDWIKDAASFAADDKNVAEQYIQDLLAIADSHDDSIGGSAVDPAN